MLEKINEKQALKTHFGPSDLVFIKSNNPINLNDAHSNEWCAKRFNSNTFKFDSLKIVFMGTPEFAVPSLAILLEHGFDIVGVVTAPDKPGGRQGLQQSPVKQFAVSHGLPVLQPEKFRNPEFIEALRAWQADLQVVVAFRMLPEMVWNMPPLGTLNLHGSLLPKYRGAAPINWAIIEGEQETGVTTFFLKHAIDTGDVILQERMPIGPDETAGELHDRMMELGAQTVLRTVQAIAAGTISPQPQMDVAATHAPKIFTETCRINFAQSAVAIHNFVRGLSPYPGAWMLIDDKTLKIYSTNINNVPAGAFEPGSIFVKDKSRLFVSTLDGLIELLEVQMQGKKRLPVRDFLNGYAGDWPKL